MVKHPYWDLEKTDLLMQCEIDLQKIYAQSPEVRSYF